MDGVTILFNKKTTTPAQRLAILDHLAGLPDLHSNYDIGLMDSGEGYAVSHLPTVPDYTHDDIWEGIDQAVRKLNADLTIRPGEPAEMQIEPHVATPDRPWRARPYDPVLHIS